MRTPALRRRPAKPVQAAIFSVKVCVLSGTANEQQLREWVQEALNRYHTFRHGYAGIKADITVAPPEITGVTLEE